ncbi:UNVERIFIED_CONTAM: Toxoplasma gondii family A protein [Hammondia hammondi]|eukprot:XP_008887107.1 Toxoplasma gondii family A protein [Hammondia hammondi]
MERHIFRAVCLALLTETVSHCVASENSATPKTKADVTTTIPKAGLKGDVEQVFSLGPSGTLQITDETGTAVYLPNPGEDVDGALLDLYGFAYRYEKGACDFNKTVKFKDAFPGYDKSLWVQLKSSAEDNGKTSQTGTVRYRFTNPPAKYLGGGLSFCVRFQTVLSSGSTSLTSTPSPSSSGSTGSADSGPSPDPVEPGPQEEDDVGKENEELPEADSQGAEGPSRPSEDAEGEQSGNPDLDGGSEGETHPEPQSPGHGSTPPQAESAPSGESSGSPAPTPDNQESRLPEVEENDGDDGGIGDSADTQDSTGQGNHDAHEDEDSQKKPSGQGGQQSEVELPDSHHEGAPSGPEPTEQKEPAISIPEQKGPTLAHPEPPKDIGENNVTAEPAREESYGLTEEKRTHEEVEGGADLTSQRKQEDFLSPKPAGHPSSEVSNPIVVEATLKQNPEDEKEIKSAEHEELHLESELDPGARSVETFQASQPVKEVHERKGIVARGTTVSTDEGISASVSQPHTAGNTVASTRTAGASRSENTVEVREGEETPIQDRGEREIIFGDQSGAALTPLTSTPNDTESPESNDQPESDETHQGSGDPGIQPPASDDGPDSLGQGSASPQGGGGTEPTEGLGGSDTHGNPSDSQGHADTPTPPSGPKVPAVNQKQGNNLSTPSETPGGSVGDKSDKGHLSSAADGVSGQQSRRLSEAAPVKDAFLTVVVHSGSRSFLSGLSSLSVFLLAVGTTLLQIS